MFYEVKADKALLDFLYEQRKSSVGPCQDCGVKPSNKHLDNCDVARCLNTKGQRLCCDCKDCGEDIWTGIWPGIKEAYKRGLVCYDTATKGIMFELNRLAEKK